jgi:hypothetical protein
MAPAKKVVEKCGGDGIAKLEMRRDELKMI